MLKDHTRGIYYALTAAFVSGISIFVNKFAVEAVGQPLVFTAVKNTGVAMLMMGIILTGRKWRKIKKLCRRELIFLVLIGIIGGSVPFYLFFTGLAMIPAINGAIIQKTLVIWVAILAPIFLKEKLSKANVIAVLVLFGANVLIGGFGGFKFLSGEGWVLLATWFWAIETILAKKILARVDPDVVSFARMGFGAVILLAISVIAQPAALARVVRFDISQWAWVGLTTVMLLTYVTTWYRALKFAPAITVTAILVASTLVTNILSAIFITHNFNTALILQTLLIVAGIKVLNQAKVSSPQISRLRQSSISG